MRMPLFHRQDTDEALIDRIAAGDTGAFDLLYERYSDRLLHYFARMLDADKARDFLQELFLKLIEKASTFAPGGCFSTWIFAIAHNMCCNEYRHMAVRRDAIAAEVDRIFPASSPPGIEQQLDQAAFRQSLRAELDRLDRDQRSTFLLRFQEGFSIDQIGRIMNCPPGTVKSRLHYTTRLLADRLRAFHPRLEEESQYE